MVKKSLLSCAALMLAVSASAFDIKAKIYPAGTETELRFKAVSKWAKANINKITVLYMRNDSRYMGDEKYVLTNNNQEIPFKVEGEEVVVKAKLTGVRKQHTFTFGIPGKNIMRAPGTRRIILLTLDEETFKLRPFKGNVHQHSKISDGKFSPEEHVAYARIAGFDFNAIADHGRITQNPLAINFAAACKSGLVVYPAEEIHTYGTILHGLAIGVQRRFSENRRIPAVERAVKPILDKLVAENPDKDVEELRTVAEGLYIARKAKKAGALVVYCHPGHWKANRINASTVFTEHVLRNRDFDVVEVVNGQVYNTSNYITWGQIYEASVETGKRWPVMSSSDCHNVSAPAFRRNYNVIFAPDCTFPSFKSAFLEFRSVAVYETDAQVGKKTVLAPLFYGPVGYMEYAEYLHKIRFWPKHDALAARQGKLILKYLAGDKTLVGQIAALAKEIDEYRESIYYSPAANK